jgi:hypothetical protein
LPATASQAIRPYSDLTVSAASRRPTARHTRSGGIGDFGPAAGLTIQICVC